MLVSEAVSSYLGELRRGGRRENTLRGYESDLRVLVECAAKRHGALDEQAVGEYLAWPTARSAATQARRLSVLRGLLRSCGRLDLLSAQHIAASTPATAPRSNAGRDLRGDIESVFAAIPRQADRDQLLFRLIARLGLRPGEALALQIEDFEEQSASLYVTGWGGRHRRVLVDDNETLLRLTNYVRFSTQRSGPLFSAPGHETPLRYQSAQHRWAQYCSAAGVSLQLSDLRRAHAADLLSGGVSEFVVRERLGQRTGPLGGAATSLSEAESDQELVAWHERRKTSAPPSDTTARAHGRAG
ncbi:tyrosine-type recombinase/integrase [Microbacterium sp. NPDC090218]